MPSSSTELRPTRHQMVVVSVPTKACSGRALRVYGLHQPELWRFWLCSLVLGVSKSRPRSPLLAAEGEGGAIFPVTG